jgi:serine protease
MSLGGSVSNTTENNAFADAYNNKGVLSIAAAGNDGSTRTSYPAGYSSVISVAAVDSTGTVASFSQKNSTVELAAPGVGVLSTTPFKASTLTAGGNTLSGREHRWLGPSVDGSGALVDGGLCGSAGSYSGKVVLCERGDIAFADKVVNAQNGGGVGVIMYNNVSGGFAGTLNGVATSIPSVSISQEDGQNIIATGAGKTATVDARQLTDANGYAFLDGTSMATPHVSGVAAIVWDHHAHGDQGQGQGRQLREPVVERRRAAA